MMLNISFDFDESTHKISNIKVTEKEIPSIDLNILCDHDMRITENKLQFTNEALQKLGVTIGDRIAINYGYAGPSNAYPIISKADIFTDGVDGLKLTKSKTLSFRGEQRDILLKYGSVFLFEEGKDKTGKIKDGVFKLIPVNKEDDSILEHNIVAIEEAAVENMNQKEIEDDADWLFEL